MTVEVFDVEQSSPEWFKLRLGLPTASNFKDVLAKGEGKVRTTYLNKLAGERVTGIPAENYTNASMERGKAVEDDARNLYAFQTDHDPVRVGFVRNGSIGCSPDALIGDDGVLEIKSVAPHLLIPMLKADKFPVEHRAQCQGSLLVSGRKWVDVILYYPSMPPLIKREYRIEPYLDELQRELDAFQRELDALVLWLQSYRPTASLGLKGAITGSLA